VPGTVQDFIALLKDQEGIPYVYGGDAPQEGFDCSGLVYYCSAQCGIPIERTSQEQWATIPHVASPLPGDIIFFDVPSDDSSQPAHEGVFLGNNQMIEAPHTGEDVKIITVPNVPGVESIMGYGRIGFPGQQMPPVPEPPKPVTPTEADGMATADPITGGEWITNAQGAVDAFDGAPYLGGLNNCKDDVGNAGSDENPCVGMAYWKGDDTPSGGQGYVLFCWPTGADKASPYRFPRDGSLKAHD
jgi:hypothetical protein